MRLGIQFQPAIPPPQLLALAQKADDLGYDSFGVTDSSLGNEPFSMLGAMAVATRRIRLVTSVASIFHRHPVTLASAARTIDDLSGGRMVLGLGTSHAEMMGRLGVVWQTPLTAMGEAIALIDRLLSGERVNYQGRHFHVQAQLVPRPLRRVAIMIGAVQPRMLHLAGAVADGVILNHLTHDFAPEAIEQVRQGARDAGRDPRDVEILCSVHTAVVANRDEARRALDIRKAMLETYVGLENYRRRYATLGFGAEMAELAAAQERGEPVAARIPDHMVEHMVNIGSAGQCRAIIDRYRAAGADSYLVAPLCVADDIAPFERTIEALGPA